MAFRRLTIYLLTTALAATLNCRRLSSPAEEQLPDWIRVYFSPQDHIPEPLISLVDSARESVWAAFYSLGLPEVASALVRSADRGVDVRVIMDLAASRPLNSQSHRLAEAGLLRTDYSPNDLMHNKFMVIDRFITWTGSYNPGLRGTYRDDNNVVVISSLRLAERYRQRFLTYWSGRFGRTSPSSPGPGAYLIGEVMVENYFSPGDDCLGRIIKLVETAEESIHFATFVFTYLPLAEAVVKKHLEGVRVSGVMEKGQDGPWSCYRLFQAAGLDVVWDRNLDYLHHKFLVIDGRTVITGSLNPSRAAETSNDENIVIIHHPSVARKFLGEFERLRLADWN